MMKKLAAAVALMSSTAVAQTTYPYPSVVAPYLPDVVREKKVAIISVQFSDIQDSHPNSAYLDWFFNAANSTNNLLAEWSRGLYSIRGKLSVDGSMDIFGPYVIAQASTACNTTTLATQAKAAMKAAGNSTTGYDHFVFVWKNVDACTFNGKFTGTDVFIRSPGYSMASGYPVWTNPNTGLAHELLHEKVMHAAGYQCKDGSTYVTLSATQGNCIRYEYANPYDLMGGREERHPGVWFKRRMGWLSDSERVSNLPTGRYTLMRHDIPSATGMQLMMWDRDSNGTATAENFRWLFVEHRAEGVMVQVTSDRQYKGHTALLDMTPRTAPAGTIEDEFLDAMLPVGATFTDPVSGISITLVDVVGNEAVVDVARP